MFFQVLDMLLEIIPEIDMITMIDKDQNPFRIALAVTFLDGFEHQSFSNLAMRLILLRSS